MKQLERLQNKNSKLIIGLMSGTSADGIDTALVRISNCGEKTKFKLVSFLTHHYPKGFKEHLLKNSQPGASSVDEIARLNILVSYFFADAVRAISKKSKIPLSKIDLIGSHGQTIHHLPNAKKYFGKTLRATLQIGDKPTLAKLTGIPVVGNFRTADMAFGGQGAPLVPYFDWLVFRSKNEHRALLNIGGISNITHLPKNSSIKDVRAFDTGPGNMIIDQLVKIFFNLPFDKNGAIAKTGRVNSLLLKEMISEKYFSLKPPKSTGRELFNDLYVTRLIKKYKSISPKDFIATATEFTALTIFNQYQKFLLQRGKINSLIVSGGGSHNKTLMNALQKYFSGSKIYTSNDFGINEDAKEAICFAILANEMISEIPSNVPSVTGATRQTILGEIAL